MHRIQSIWCDCIIKDIFNLLFYAHVNLSTGISVKSKTRRLSLKIKIKISRLRGRFNCCHFLCRHLFCFSRICIVIYAGIGCITPIPTQAGRFAKKEVTKTKFRGTHKDSSGVGRFQEIIS